MSSHPGRSSATAEGVTPFFFADGDALFGLYHEPRSLADRDTGIVVCNPFGREHLYSHRALRHVALRLSEQGFHVLRFDYSGTGDSVGEGDGASLARWARDVDAAIEELERRTGLTRVALVGLRLGGSLAWLSASARRDVEALVLWEPIASGRAYLEEIDVHDGEWRTERNVPPEDPPGAAVLGFPAPDGLRAELHELKLPLDTSTRPARQLLLVRRDPLATDDVLENALRGFGARAEAAHCPSSAFWRRDEGEPAVVVPGPPVRRILGWLDEALL